MKIFSLLTVAAMMMIGPVSFANDYQGASFNEVWDIIKDKNYTPETNIEKKEFAVYANGKLPTYPVSNESVFGQGEGPLERDAKRTTTERFDYYDRLPKRLHPNGVCVAGKWTIEAKTGFTGLLATEASGLFIGRISVAMGETTSDEKRGFGIAGKVFPTLGSNTVVDTANFFTVDVLMGTKLDQVLKAATTNEPETGFRFSLIGLGLKIASALKTADNNPGFRPLTQLAAANQEAGTTIKQPRWIRLKLANKIKHNDEADFRNEVLKAFNDNEKIVYGIEVSDTTKDRNDTSGWTKIGSIELDKAQVSYGCDRRLHFSHPKLK